MDASDVSLSLSPDATATVRHGAGRTLVTVVGEVDQRAAAACETLVRLAAEGASPVHVDLGGVTFFSAAGITWLVRLRHAAGEVRVMAASGPVRELLRVCGMPTTSGSGVRPRRHADAC